jgi:hypothetical protein
MMFDQTGNVGKHFPGQIQLPGADTGSWILLAGHLDAVLFCLVVMSSSNSIVAMLNMVVIPPERPRKLTKKMRIWLLKVLCQEFYGKNKRFINFRDCALGVPCALGSRRFFVLPFASSRRFRIEDDLLFFDLITIL